MVTALVSIYIALQPPKLSIPHQEDRILSNVTIWNPGTSPVAQQVIHIIDGVIKDIRPSLDSDPVAICDNCFAMPGLIDAHVHTPPSLAFGNRELFSLLYLQHGITSIRDLGQFDDDLPDLVDQLNMGKLAGPHMYYCGRILDGDPVSVPGAVLVTTPDEGRQTVANHARSGVDCIKTYGNISADVLKGVSKEAKRLGLPHIGHTPHTISLRDIQNFESQHYTGIPYLTKPAPKDWAYKSQDLINMTPTDIQDVLHVMATNTISFLPTNANTQSRLTVSDPERFPPSEGFRHLPTFWELAWPSIVSHPETEAEIQTELDARNVGLSFIRQAHESGIDVLVGTDVIMPYVVPGEAMHQQLQLIAQALGSPERALQAATKTNGNHIDPGKIGELSVGAYADLLLFREDPRGPLENIQQWDFVMVKGRLYTREEVDAAVDRFDQHFRGPVYSTIMNTAYGFMAADYEDSEISKH